MTNKKIIFSFDDNDKLNTKIVDMFEEFNFRATFFINIYGIEDDQSIDIIDIYQRGFEIGSHTMTHANLMNISKEKAQWEIVQSKKYLEKLLNVKISGFCYPFGSYNNILSKIIEENGYRYARITGEGCTYNFNKYTIKPTVQIYNTLPRRLARTRKYILGGHYSSIGDWYNTSIKFIRAEKGIIHIWGHAADIESQKQWEKLEKLLDWIYNNGYMTDSMNKIF